MDVIFTIVSRNYAAQAATLMESLAKAEPRARRIVVATDGPIPTLERLAEVVDVGTVGAPFEAMTVYYDALELNTAVKPFVFKHFMGQPGVTSVTYLDPDIYVFKPLDPVRRGLAEAQLVLTPHNTQPMLGDANPNDQALLRSGVYNLGFCSVRNEPKTLALMSWWADRCRFDCRVDLANGLFTDQKWMDLSPTLVDSVYIHRRHDLNLAYWNLEGRKLARGKAGWTIDGAPLRFFHFSGFDPQRPKILSKHQNRVVAAAGSPLAELLAEFAQAMLRNGHLTHSVIPYAYNRFESGRTVSALMRRCALRAARGGERFAGGLGATAEAWFDAADPDAAEPGLPDITRLMEQVWRENPAADPFDRTTVEGRLGFHQWYADNALVLGADAPAVAAAQGLARKAGGSARSPDAKPWRGEPWRGPAQGALSWLRELDGATPRACRALLAARGDLRQRFAKDPEALLAWCLGPEAAAGRFAADLLPDAVLDALAKDTTPLFLAARMTERGDTPTDLRRKLGAGFGAGARGGWPERLTAPLREPYLAVAEGYPAPFIKLFLDIWDQRPDLRRLYPLISFIGRLRYLRWLIAGGLAEYGVEISALPPNVRRHPLMRLAELTLRRRHRTAAPAPAGRTGTLVVIERDDILTLPSDVTIYDAATGRFSAAGAPVSAPRQVDLVCFTTAPGMIPADAIALHARGVSWTKAVGAWDSKTLAKLSDKDIALGFVDEVWSPAGREVALWRPARALDPASRLEAALARALAS